MEEKALVLGDDINTDDIIPAKRCSNPDPEYLAGYAFEHILADGAKLSDYSVIRAGANFGCGSSREHAPIAIKAAGIRKVVASSFADIFFRNSINIGLPLEVVGEPARDLVIDAITGAGGLTSFNRKRLAGSLSAPKSRTGPRPMTVAEKILARASGNDFVQPGETVFARVDLLMSHDGITGPAAKVFHDGYGKDARVWDADKIVLVADHIIQVGDVRDDPRVVPLHRAMQAFAEEQGCRLFDEIAPGEAQGICHVLLPQKGLIKPGELIVGTDSHSCTYGAFGALSTGIGTTDMGNLLATGDIWIRVPATQRYVLKGRPAESIAAKDIMLSILRRISVDGATGRVMEFVGEVIDRMSIDERMTLANMSVEAGAVCGIVLPDQKTVEYVRNRGAGALKEVLPDTDAAYESVLEFDLTDLKPQVARPSNPDNVVDVDEVGDVPITKAFIGSCTGGKLDDLANAAAVIEGKKVAAGVKLFVVPASQEVRQAAERLGYMESFRKAGAVILKSGCGACINCGQGALQPGEAGVFATNRNYKGRSGDPTAHNYLASPRVVALSAVRGRISDS